MKIQIEIEDHIKDRIVKEDLSWHINNAMEILSDKTTPKKEREYLKKLLAAFGVVGKYYGIK
jgi:hypothetical protein